MQGAREYATMLRSGQHGRLYLVSGEHARGKTWQLGRPMPGRLAQ